MTAGEGNEYTSVVHCVYGGYVGIYMMVKIK